MEVRYERMRPGELAAAREAAPLVYLPVGSIEYHGLHLPVGFDSLHAYQFCLEAAKQTGGVVLPVLFWGTQGHQGWPGSLLISGSALTLLVRDILVQLEQQGYKLVVICMGHHPQELAPPLERAAKEFAAVRYAESPGTSESRPEACKVLITSPFEFALPMEIDHAALMETSICLELFPEMTDMSVFSHDPEAHKGLYGKDPTQATPDLGREYFDLALSRFVPHVKSLLG